MSGNEGTSGLNNDGAAPPARTFGPMSAKTRAERQASVGAENGPGSSHSNRFNPFNTISPLNTSSSFASLSSPTSAFGLGSGAFASFGAKTPTAIKPNTEGSSQSLTGNSTSTTPAPIQPTATFASAVASSSNKKVVQELTSHPLRYTWVVWYRAPGTKFQDYEKSTQKIAAFSTVEEFWIVYSHLKRPSTLPHVSDYHIFKKGIRPVWEDEENRKGGKWIIRLKKGVSSRYWEDLLLAIIGDQFGESGDDLCGAVLSIRGQEDVLSVWTRIETGANLKIRETIKRVLAFPAETVMVFKSHDESIAQERTVHQGQQKPGTKAEKSDRTDKVEASESDDKKEKTSQR